MFSGALLNNWLALNSSKSISSPRMNIILLIGLALGTAAAPLKAHAEDDSAVTQVNTILSQNFSIEAKIPEGILKSDDADIENTLVLAVFNDFEATDSIKVLAQFNVAGTYTFSSSQLKRAVENLKNKIEPTIGFAVVSHHPDGSDPKSTLTSKIRIRDLALQGSVTSELGTITLLVVDTVKSKQQPNVSQSQPQKTSQASAPSSHSNSSGFKPRPGASWIENFGAREMWKTQHGIISPKY